MQAHAAPGRDRAPSARDAWRVSQTKEALSIKGVWKAQEQPQTLIPRPQGKPERADIPLRAQEFLPVASELCSDNLRSRSLSWRLVRCGEIPQSQALRCGESATVRSLLTKPTLRKPLIHRREMDPRALVLARARVLGLRMQPCVEPPRPLPAWRRINDPGTASTLFLFSPSQSPTAMTTPSILILKANASNTFGSAVVAAGHIFSQIPSGSSLSDCLVESGDSISLPASKGMVGEG
ncbi:uncharacterized protein LOC124980702 [Sciurus carolinensis]|uniref:uncharacterized protein LOC124980702 n=1 Tax=Sciurus carolinensis TaxID=30640 RepID=UPI001FB20498|nr:uncharacterized protein LOC124980702 [Sciurus carolinensis]